MALTLEELIKELQDVAKLCEPKLTLTSIVQISYFAPEGKLPATVVFVHVPRGKKDPLKS